MNIKARCTGINVYGFGKEKTKSYTLSAGTKKTGTTFYFNYEEIGDHKTPNTFEVDKEYTITVSDKESEKEDKED